MIFREDKTELMQRRNVFVSYRWIENVLPFEYFKADLPYQLV